MLDIKNFSRDFSQKFPEFITFWKTHTYYEPEEFAAAFDKNSPLLWQHGMTVLSNYVVSNYASMTDNDLATLFDYIEKSLVSSDELLGTGITTGFLEGITNRVCSSSPKLPPSIIKFFGPESKAYCIAWDEFCKTKTPGLYEE